MTPEQLSSMNTWLAVIAIASVIQVIALAVVAMVGYRLYSRSRVAIDDVQRQIEPVTRRVTEVLDNVNQEVARLRRGHEGRSGRRHSIYRARASQRTRGATNGPAGTR